VEEEEEERNGQRVISMSPVKGSQGAPEIDLSSQEEVVQKENQDIDWDLIQEEDGQNSELFEMDVENEREKGLDKSEQLDISEEKEMTTVEESQRKVTTKTRVNDKSELIVISEENKMSSVEEDRWEKSAEGYSLVT
jgi:hypothetical protein